MPTRSPLGPVRVRADAETVTISVHGHLDALAGDALIDSLRHELDRAPQKVAVDLLEIDAWTAEGAVALRRCELLADGLSTSVTFRTNAGAGHEALLAAYTDDGAHDEEAAE
jgi:hypothetical protein